MRYSGKMTGYSPAQVKRLITQYRKTGRLERKQRTVKSFSQKYTVQDKLHLAALDERHGTLSGPATKKLCERAYTIFGEYKNDNALAESKNAAVVRKHFGYAQFPQKWALLINQFNQFNQNTLNPYINYHSLIQVMGRLSFYAVGNARSSIRRYRGKRQSLFTAHDKVELVKKWHWMCFTW